MTWVWVVVCFLCVCLSLCSVLCGLKAWFIHVPPPFFSCPAPTPLVVQQSLAWQDQSGSPEDPSVCGVCVFVCLLLAFLWVSACLSVVFFCLCVYVFRLPIQRSPEFLSDCVLSPLIWITMSGGMQAVCCQSPWITQNELSTVSPDVLWPALRVCLCPTWYKPPCCGSNRVETKMENSANSFHHRHLI